LGKIIKEKKIYKGKIMANLLEVQGSVIPIGTIIQAVGPPDSTWLKCNGSILAKSSYPGYVANAGDLHPLMWKNWKFIDVDQSVTGTAKYAISRMGDTIVCVGIGSTVWISTDGGATWSTNTGLSAGTHYCLANNGTYFVTARYGSTEAYYSSDGATWNSATLPATRNWRYLTYANGYFVLMHNTSQSPTYYAYSSNGTSWSEGTAPFSNGYPVLNSDGSKHILFAYSSGTYYKIHTSTNGSTWSSGTLDFFHGEPDYNDSYPNGIYYVNGEYYMTWGSYEDYWYLKYEGSDIKSPNDWYRYNLQPAHNVTYFKINCMVGTGNHIIVPNGYSTKDGILVGPSMENLNFYRNAMPGVIGIVNDGEDYAVILPITNGYKSIGRCTGVEYDTSTYFQLPLETLPDIDRIYSYIKVAE
jgi:hypothetical protein